jgi:hypothetical protein
VVFFGCGGLFGQEQYVDASLPLLDGAEQVGTLVVLIWHFAATDAVWWCYVVCGGGGGSTGTFFAARSSVLTVRCRCWTVHSRWECSFKSLCFLQ